jgi:hypothetical protein
MSVTELVINQSNLDFNDPPILVWVKVQDALGLLWSENPKLHDIGSVISSIQKHGLQELPKFDSQIGIKAGNGRVECLALMERDGSYELPRGLARNQETGEWAMPLLMGTDAKSRELAESYAIDSNNLTMAGGNFTPFDVAKMWDNVKYSELLTRLANDADEHPVTVDGDILDSLLATMAAEMAGPDAPEDFGEYDDETIATEYRCPKCSYEWSGSAK